MTSGFKRRREIEAEQPLLFAAPTRTRTENPRIYSAIAFLRARGHQVYRVSGTQGRVNGKLCINKEITAMAKKIGWVGKKKNR